MNFLVVGAGAIGSVFGGLLAKDGHQVALVGRKSHMDAVREQGLSIGGIWGEHLVRGFPHPNPLPEGEGIGIKTGTDISDLTSRTYDAVLITTKSYDTALAVQEALPVVGTDTLVVSLQNGLGNIEVIERTVGASRTVGARVIFGVDLERPGRAVVTVWGGDVMVGSPNGSIAADRIKSIADTFTHAGIKSQATDKVLAYIWGKVLYNVALNALSALLRVPYGELPKQEPTRHLMEAMIEESFAVARAAGAPLLWSTPDEYCRVLFDELVPPTAAHYSSMYADLQHGKRTEIDAMNGAIVRLGKVHGVSTPMNQTVMLLVKASEAAPPK